MFEKLIEIDLGQKARKEVVNFLVSPLHKNRKVIKKITGVIGTDKMQVRSVFSPGVIRVEDEPLFPQEVEAIKAARGEDFLTYEFGEVLSIEKILMLLERLAYDAFVVSIIVEQDEANVFRISAIEDHITWGLIEVFPVRQQEAQSRGE